MNKILCKLWREVLRTSYDRQLVLSTLQCALSSSNIIWTSRFSTHRTVISSMQRIPHCIDLVFDPPPHRFSLFYIIFWFLEYKLLNVYCLLLSWEKSSTEQNAELNKHYWLLPWNKIKYVVIILSWVAFELYIPFKWHQHLV